MSGGGKIVSIMHPARSGQLNSISCIGMEGIITMPRKENRIIIIINNDIAIIIAKRMTPSGFTKRAVGFA